MSDKTDNYEFYCNCYLHEEVNINRVFFESHNSSDFAGNMLSIVREIVSNPIYRNKFEIIISCLPENKNKIDSLLEYYGIIGCCLVYRETREYFKALATAKFLFTDVAQYPLYRKKKGQICITTWHGTPLKTIGYTYYQDSYVVGNQKRGFCLADYFICPNVYTWNCIRTSYQLDGLFKGDVLLEGYPRNAIFFNGNRRDSLKAELISEGKKLIAYMPTWRGRVIQVNSEEQTAELQKLLSEIDEKMPANYIMWAKLHRLNQASLDFSEFKNIRPFPEGYETYDILNIADVLVTDYSSVMFDFAVTHKKIILYCYDKEDYISNRGCYFNIERLPFPIVTDVDALVSEFTTDKLYDDSDFYKNFCSDNNLYSVEKIVKEIFSGKHLCRRITVDKNKQKKSLVFTGELRNGNSTDALFDFLEDNNDVFITYMNHLFKDNFYKLLQFGDKNQVPFYMYQERYSNYTTSEVKVIDRIRENLTRKTKVASQDWEVMEHISIREYVRYTYENFFYRFIRFAGLDLESLKFFRVFAGEKIIYVHDDMVKKAENNYEYNVYLKRALDVATSIHFANEKIFERCKTIWKDLNGRIIIENLY